MALAGCTLATQSAPPPLAIVGTIVYSRGDGLNGTVWMANGDGSVDLPVAAGARPRLAPDGRHMLFHRGQADPARGDLWMRDLATGTETLIFANNDYVVGMDWLPDSTHFYHDYGCGIYRRNADGSNPLTLFAVDCYDDAPTVNPSGSQIAFHNIQPGRGLLLANLDGSGRAVVPNSIATGNGSTSDVLPAWSPDGQWLGFGNGSDLHKMRPDGTGRLNLTAGSGFVRTFFAGAGSLAPAWTTDGQWLVTPMTVDGTGGLYAAKADGTGELRKLTTKAGDAITWVGIAPANAMLGFAAHAETELGIAAPAYAAVGAPFAYTFTVRNHGPLPTAGLVLTNPLPPGLEVTGTSASAGTVTAAAGKVVATFNPIPVGSTATVTVTGVATTNAFLVLAANTAQTRPDADFNGTVSATVGAVAGTTGSIAVPGERDTYSFTVAGGKRLVYFDALVDSDRWLWRLDGPAGAVVNDTAFRYADGDRIGDIGSVLALQPGAHSLTIRGTEETTGDYAFHLIDLSTAPLLTPGTTGTANFAPGNATLAYQFPVVAGDHVSVDLLGRVNLGGFHWRLVDPRGNVVAANAYANSGDIVLTVPGNHFLLLEGSIYNTGTGSLTFAVTPHGNTPPPAPAGTPLAFGAVAEGTAAAASDVAHYLVHADQPIRFAFDVLSTKGFNWSLRGTMGIEVDRQGFYYSDYPSGAVPTWYIVPGDYELTVTGATGDFRFRLLDLAGATPFAIGTAMSVTNTPAIASNLLRFEGTAGQRIFYAAGGIEGFQYSPYIILYTPQGSQLGAYYAGSDNTFVLPSTGTYTVSFTTYPADAAASGITRFTLFSPETTTDPLVLGATVTNHLDLPGQIRRHTFALASPKFLYFDSLVPQGPIRWTLDGPTGQVVGNRSFSGSDSYYGFSPLNLAAGNYTITVSGSGQATGGYAFRLLDAAAGQLEVPGNNVVGDLVPGNATDVHRYNLTAGQRFYLDMQSPADGYYRLLDPFGRVVVESYLSNDRANFGVGVTGTYTLYIEGPVPAAQPTHYAFNLRPVVDGSTPLPGFDTPVAGAIASAGQVQRHTFTLAGPRQIYFDSLTNQPSLSWNLDGPDGRIIGGRRFTGSDGVNGFVALNLGAGDYTISIAGDADATGGYAFRLLDSANATALVPGTEVNDVLPRADATRAYRFEAIAGQTFYLDFVGGADLANAYYRLVDPHARSIVENYLPNDRGPFTVSTTGRHVLYVEGWIGATTPAAYRFNLLPVADGTQSLALGADVGGSIGSPGQTQRHTFSLATRKQLYFDTLADRSELFWTLDGPLGRVVDSRILASTDSDRGFAWLDLPAGNYSLAIRGNGDAVGSYAFRMLDLTAAPPLVPGTGLAGTLSPANRTDAYRFHASAGDQFTRQSTGDNAYVRLIDPLGRQTDANYLLYFGGNTAKITLPLDGTYTLLVEGYARAAAPSGYTLNLVPAGSTPPPPFTGTPLAFDTRIDGTLASAADATNYVFTLATPKRLAFDTLGNSHHYWRVTGLQGNVTGDREIFYSDWYGGAGRLLDLPAGNYQLTLFNVAGDFAFRLQDTAIAPALPIGSVVNGTNAPANSQSVWRFEGTAGQRYYFRGLGFLDFPSRAYGTLFGPDNQSVFGASMDQDADVFALPKTGTYLFVVDRPPDDAAAQSGYSFEFYPVADASNTLVLGQDTAGKIASPGQQQVYAFSLPSARRF